ncbi:MAG: hypothetical protein P8171_14475, partial [Candidatus Thiodiazotropha sp.]
LILESLLGLRLETDRLYIEPCLPAHWSGLKIHYRYGETVYHLVVAQICSDEEEKRGVRRIKLDNIEQVGGAIVLTDDRLEHRVEVEITTCVQASS